MSATGVIAIILIATLLSFLFSYGFGQRGPWGSIWTFLLILILGIWTVNVWVSPYGPVWYGAAWLDILFIGVLISLVLSVATPSARRYRAKSISSKSAVVRKEQEAVAAAGGLFWIIMLLFIVLS
jgi:hypothetical protein